MSSDNYTTYLEGAGKQRLIKAIVESDKRIEYLEKALQTAEHILRTRPAEYASGYVDVLLVIEKALKGEESEKGEHAKSRTNV
jgi:hypothetical protein